jgi:tetratricopeptide (TPR) repeat protein
VVVEAFDSPPALTAQGLTGKVVVAGVLDELNRLQAVTKTSAATRDVSNAWASEAKLAVPAPDLPAAYFSWGVALAKHGDLAGAEAKLAAANRRGPHWADPLKASGNVLVKQGKTKDALAKYDEALKYAPIWKELTEAREVVAKRKG